jgi:hypothetical protein
MLAFEALPVAQPVSISGDTAAVIVQGSHGILPVFVGGRGVLDGAPNNTQAGAQRARGWVLVLVVARTKDEATPTTRFTFLVHDRILQENVLRVRCELVR